MNNKFIDQFTPEEEARVLNDANELQRVVQLQDESKKVYEKMLQDIKDNIKDKEDLATKWMGILIVISLVQLYPFKEAAISINYLILVLPTFCIAFYTTALTLFKHPNAVTTDSFIVESSNLGARYFTNKALLEIYNKAGQAMKKTYEWKGKFLRYTGPAVIVNFTLSVLFLIEQTVFNLDIPLCVYIIGSIISIELVPFISYLISRNNFVLQYTTSAPQKGGDITLSKS